MKIKTQVKKILMQTTYFQGLHFQTFYSFKFSLFLNNFSYNCKKLILNNKENLFDMKFTFVQS